MSEEKLIVCKRFAGEEHDIRDFVTPNQVEILGLFAHIKDEYSPLETAAMCWRYLNKYVQYPSNGLGLTIDKHRLITFGGAETFDQPPDPWQFPYETTARVRWAAKRGRKTFGDCADVTFVLASVLRNQLGPSEVHACIGTYLLNGTRQGHAWVKMRYDLNIYYCDPTHNFGSPIDFSKYEEYVLFNDVDLVIDRDPSNLLYP